jgi:arginine/ornithine N-succinyltransferase beta subunit
MPLEIRPVEECDFADFVRIQIAAFSGGGMTTLIKPSPMPSDYNEKSVKNHLKSWRGERDVHYLKVVDTDLGGKMIACAKWPGRADSRGG